MIHSSIVGSGSFIPSRSVKNVELVKELNKRGIYTTNDWIFNRTGINKRHIADYGTNTSHLATAASLNALKNSGINVQELDLIIVATSTPDCIFPSTACLVQEQLGIKKAAAFDIQAVCSGFIYALNIADSFIKSGKSKCALVVGSEVFSKILDWNDRKTCVLFGDGSGAIILKSSSVPGIISSDFNADGSISNILYAAGNISYGKIFGDPFLRMDGRSVFKQAISVLERSAKNICNKSGVKISNIDWLVPHQANIRILKFLANRLSKSMKNVVVTLDNYANTSAASIPISLDIAIRDGRIKDYHLVLMQGVGGGFTWGSILARIRIKRNI